MKKLDNRVALVTGTSPNIGGGIAEGLAEAGADVVCIDSRIEHAEACATYLESTGVRAWAFACDVTNADEVAETVRQATQASGGIDVLVNNAAYFNRKGVLDMPVDEWRAQVDVILTGAFLFTQHVARNMIERDCAGSIINIISTAGHQGEPRNVAYSTAKSGLMNFTRSCAMELAEHGIRVNSLTPTATDPAESFDRAERWGIGRERPANLGNAMRPFRDGIPMQKLPRPSDYGGVAAFLASDDASMITGEDLRVDGGAVARYWAWTPDPS